MKIALIGANGQLAYDILRVFDGYEMIGFTHAELDITHFDELRDKMGSLKPDVIINTAAYHRVDECEDYPDRSFLVNAIAVRELAKISVEMDAVLVHFSTDYVFGGDKDTPYTEADMPMPLSVYGTSKLAGEYFVRSIAKRFYLIRTCGLYGNAGSSGKGGNFVETMIKLAKAGKHIRVVSDQIVTPTYTYDLAVKIKELLKTDSYGLYHITSSGSCSWYEFAREIFNMLSISADIEPITTEEFGAKARRPSYSVLDNEALRKVGISDMREWKEALGDYLKEKGYI